MYIKPAIVNDARYQCIISQRLHAGFDVHTLKNSARFDFRMSEHYNIQAKMALMNDALADRERMEGDEKTLGVHV